MPQIIKPKRGTGEPPLGSLQDGEIAIDTAGAKLYQRVGSEVVEIGGGGEPLPSAVSLTYQNDLVDVVTETVDGATKTTTLFYDADDLVTSVQIDFQGVRRTETFTYTDGLVTGIAVSEGPIP